jgi:hypothetical protein
MVVTVPAIFPDFQVPEENPFVYYVCNIFNGDVLEELPFTQFQYSRTKNRPGGWSAEIPYRHPKVTPGLLEPWTRAIYVGKDERILSGGILQHRNTSTGESMKIGGEGFFSYFREGRRSIRSRVGMSNATGTNNYEVTFTQKEQFDIVSDILTHASVYAGGASIDYDDIIYHGPGASGQSNILRDRTYWTYEYKEIGEAIEQLSEVINGFDFSDSFFWDNGRIGRNLDLWYPYKIGPTPITFEVGANVILLNRDEDGDELATRAIALGSGEADAQLASFASDSSQEYPTGAFPLLESIETYSDVSIRSTLTSHAQHDLNQKRRLKDTLETKITNLWETELGAFDWGDSVIAYANDGALQVDDVYRIESYTVTIDQNGGTSIEPSLASFDASVGT